jgi:RNA-directed DNA polymerase
VTALPSSASRRRSAEGIFKPRRYLHFDYQISEELAESIATNPKRVASWPFLPMLRSILVVKKIKRVTAGRLVKKAKERPICYASHRDAAIYSYYGRMLLERYEAILKHRGLDLVVTAFRPDSGKCNIHFAKEVFDWIRAQPSCVALAFDITSFFDNLDHILLKRQWAAVLRVRELPPDHYAVFKSLTRFATADRDAVLKALGISKHNPRKGGRRRLCSAGEFRAKIRGAGLVEVNPNRFGIPQGSPMSAALSNIYMSDFDSAAHAKVREVGGLYRRYCDDMLCIVPDTAEEEVERFVMEEIRKVNLEIQPEKTMKHRFERRGSRSEADQELQYLGFLFDGDRVLLRNAGISRFYAKMRAGVRLAALTKKKADKKLSKENAEKNPLRRKKLNIRYSYVGGRNFPAYAFRAAHEFGDSRIKKQIRRHWRKLNQKISKAHEKLSEE